MECKRKVGGIRATTFYMSQLLKLRENNFFYCGSGHCASSCVFTNPHVHKLLLLPPSGIKKMVTTEYSQLEAMNIVVW
jgi:hypothetical protein